MSEKPTSQNNDLDDKLAEFADQVLGGQEPHSTNPGNEDEEMRSLAQIVMLLDEEFSSDQPSPDMADRIKSNLVTEWHRSNPGMQAASSSKRWWQRLTSGRASGYKQQQLFTFAFIAVMVVVLMVVMVSPSADGALSGAAEGGGGILLPVLLLGAVLLGVLVWLLRRRS